MCSSYDCASNEYWGEIMKKLFAGAAALLFSTASIAPAQAATLTLTYTGQFQGTLNAQPFDVFASFTGIGDTDDVQFNGFSYNLQLESLTALSGGVTYTITDPTFAYVNIFGFAGLEFGTFDDTNFFSGDNEAELAGYDFSSDVGPVAINYFNPIVASFNTDLGPVTITGASNGTFAADVGLVPEPATWAMMIGGIGAAGGALRRRKANVSVRYA